MSETPGQVTELEARYAALRQAASSKGAAPGDVLDAAFTELEGAIDLLRVAGAAPAEPGRRPPAVIASQASSVTLAPLASLITLVFSITAR